MKIFIAFLFFLTSLKNFGQTRQTLDSLTFVLEKIFDEDQSTRHIVDSLQRKFGRDSDSVNNYWRKLKIMDSTHVSQIREIIELYGWLGSDKVSKKGNTAFFLAIQHSDLETQKKFLPKLKKAIEQKHAEPEWYAYLADRILMFSSKFQIYGTQIGSDFTGKPVIWPIRDAPSVDSRRKELGLGSLEKYAADAGIEFTIPKVDSLKNVLIINGYVMGQDRRGIDSVKVLNKRGEILAQSGRNGWFKLIVNMDSIDSLSLIKPGYKKLPIKIERKDEDIIYPDFTLFKIQ